MAGLIFGVALVPLVLFILIARLGLVFPRLGRWIDRRAYRAAPRFGHLYMNQEEVDAESRREQQLGAASEPVGTSADGSSAAREAFGAKQRR